MAGGDTNRQRKFIDILDDDSLLTIFYHCRPDFSEEDGIDTGGVDSRIDIRVPGGKWERERWWYKPTQVCRRWRHLILASPSYLGLSLVCVSGTPVADMLAHSPPFPLIIDSLNLSSDIPATNEEGTCLALAHHDRARRIRLRMRVQQLMRIIAAIDGSFPLLEHLYICPLTPPDTNWPLPSTLRAPRLRHLVLHNIAFPIGSPLLAGLVTLSLEYINPFANFSPNELLQQLSLIPHLETFNISFYPPLSNEDIEIQLFQMPLPTHVTLPALRWFGFEGPSSYMATVLPWITMPLLEVIEVVSTTSNPLTSSIIFFLQSMSETENPGLCSVKVTFYNVHIIITMYPHKRTDVSTLRLRLLCSHPALGLASTVEVFDLIKAVFTDAESLTLEDKTSSEFLKDFAIRTESRWRELLKSFNKVQTLYVSGGNLIEGLSRSLRPRNRESAIELLPMLRVLSCPKGSHVGKSCRSFIASRRKTGYPVTISHH